MLLAILSVLIALALAVTLYMSLAPQFGARPTGERLARIQRSPNFRGGKFHNSVPTSLSIRPGNWVAMTLDFFRGGPDREPDATIPTLALDRSAIGKDKTRLVVTWLGHSAALIEIGGQVILTDPALGGRSSPVPFAGPKPFAYSHPVTVADLPAIDAMIISHDHFDHLDYGTIVALKDRVPVFLTALGVGAHLERWGVPADRIVELDWWQEAPLGDLTISAAPARHFSGRGMLYGFKTLFASWVIRGPEHRVFFGGDSGYFDGFKQIGDKYGPFDLTMLECGAYSKYWPTLHLMPEETARAHLDLRGRILVPIHWAKFNLSLHSWTEPVQRLRAAAEKLGATVATPMVGQRFAIGEGEEVPQKSWWQSVRRN